MNFDPHTVILETHFFGYIDRGIGADETPLFTRTIDGRPLVTTVAQEFRLSPPCAEESIALARKEVAL